MKRKFENKVMPIVLAGIFLVAGGAAYLLGFVKIAFMVGQVNVAIYPAAFLALVGAVLVWRIFADASRQS